MDNVGEGPQLGSNTYSGASGNAEEEDAARLEWIVDERPCKSAGGKLSFLFPGARGGKDVGESRPIGGAMSTCSLLQVVSVLVGIGFLETLGFGSQEVFFKGKKISGFSILNENRGSIHFLYC